jgi:hypothetical protein
MDYRELVQCAPGSTVCGGKDLRTRLISVGNLGLILCISLLLPRDFVKVVFWIIRNIDLLRCLRGNHGITSRGKKMSIFRIYRL